MNQKEIKQTIKQSAKDKQVLRITYIDKNGDRSKRNVEPYEIRNGKLWGYCRKRKSIRQFQLNKIERAIVTKYSYFPKWPVKINTKSLDKTASEGLDYWRYQLGNRSFGNYWNAELE